MTSPLDGKVAPFGNAVDKLHAFLHEPAGDIVTDAGAMPNLRKLSNELRDIAASTADETAGDRVMAIEDRIYPGVYSTPPTHKPHSGEPSAEGDKCIILVGTVPYEHTFLGGGWNISNLDGALIQDATNPANGASRVGFGNRTLRQKLLELPSPTDGPWNAVANGLASNTAALNEFVGDVTEGEFPSGAFKSGPIVFNMGRSFRTRTFGKTRSGQTVIRLDGDHERLLWYANLNEMGAGDSRHLSWDGFLFDGDGHSIADALWAIEGAYQVRYQNCGFVNSKGRVLRLRQTNEVSLAACLFADNDCSAQELIYFDEVAYKEGTPFANFNVNNVTFDDNCHFENNKGTYVRVHPNANLDILRFIGAKFEMGSVPFDPANPKDWVLFDLVNCHRFYMGGGTTFTNFRKETNFAKIFKFSSPSGELCQGGMIEATQFRGISGTTQLLDRGVGASVLLGKGITFQSVDGNAPSISNTSKYAFPTAQGPSNVNASNGGVTTGDLFHRHGPISSHDTAWNTGRFVVDAGSQNPQGTVYCDSGDGIVLGHFENVMASRNPTAALLVARVRRNGSVGGVRFQVGSSLKPAQAIANAYGVYTYAASAAELATLGDNAADRLRLVSSGADTYFVDWTRLILLPGANPGIAVPFFSQLINYEDTVQIPLPTSAHPNHRGIYLLQVDATISDVGAIIESSGASLGVLAKGAHVSVGNANPDTAGNFNYFLTGSVLTVKNRYFGSAGAPRRLSVFVFAG